LNVAKLPLFIDLGENKLKEEPLLAFISNGGLVLEIGLNED
jgi:hypothetical protein